MRKLFVLLIFGFMAVMLMGSNTATTSPPVPAGPVITYCSDAPAVLEGPQVYQYTTLPLACRLPVTDGPETQDPFKGYSSVLEKPPVMTLSMQAQPYFTLNAKQHLFKFLNYNMRLWTPDKALTATETNNIRDSAFT